MCHRSRLILIRQKFVQLPIWWRQHVDLMLSLNFRKLLSHRRWMWNIPSTIQTMPMQCNRLNLWMHFDWKNPRILSFLWNLSNGQHFSIFQIQFEVLEFREWFFHRSLYNRSTTFQLPKMIHFIRFQISM